MDTLTTYLQSLRQDYEDLVQIEPPQEQDRNNIPEPLHILYATLSASSLPFGRIYSLEHARRESQLQPFAPEWFVFGKDNYFSFWLCAYRPDGEGLWFTVWDHESGTEIDGAAFATLVELLEDQREEWEEFEESFREEEA